MPPAGFRDTDGRDRIAIFAAQRTEGAPSHTAKLELLLYPAPVQPGRDEKNLAGRSAAHMHPVVSGLPASTWMNTTGKMAGMEAEAASTS